MHVLGLLGGVASGKSLVAKLLAERGAVALDADRAGHEALRLPHVEAAVRRQFGAGVFGPDGRVDRSRLARIVFDPSAEGKARRLGLERLTHPEIARRLARQIETQARDAPLVVLDAALILEAGWDKLCDKLAFVDAPPEVRRARAAARGWTPEEFAAREAAQESLDFKRRRADVVIDNSAAAEDTGLQVDRLWQSLVG
ncbi:MAG: dephospho-CoA kinase [Thermoguttaceae bacterium]|jgi:dephospho-CoA kinase